MNAEGDGLWWMVVIVTGAVGTAMFVYGVRQKEPLPLVFGIVIGIVPMVIESGWGAAAVSVGVGVLYWVMRKYM
ncbi:MAG: hypothetical protein HZB26_19895 [Candidatus Hydrogenedentes bacterium]|nr:hypothetical protein [Candidatus Hydrogenedentota bacterium]